MVAELCANLDGHVSHCAYVGLKRAAWRPPWTVACGVHGSAARHVGDWGALIMVPQQCERCAGMTDQPRILRGWRAEVEACKGEFFLSQFLQLGRLLRARMVVAFAGWLSISTPAPPTGEGRRGCTSIGIALNRRPSCTNPTSARSAQHHAGGPAAVGQCRWQPPAAIWAAKPTMHRPCSLSLHLPTALPCFFTCTYPCCHRYIAAAWVAMCVEGCDYV